MEHPFTLFREQPVSSAGGMNLADDVSDPARVTLGVTTSHNPGNGYGRKSRYRHSNNEHCPRYEIMDSDVFFTAPVHSDCTLRALGTRRRKQK